MTDQNTPNTRLPFVFTTTANRCMYSAMTANGGCIAAMCWPSLAVGWEAACSNYWQQSRHTKTHRKQKSQRMLARNGPAARLASQ
jgi:hypothetical protein